MSVKQFLPKEQLEVYNKAGRILEYSTNSDVNLGSDFEGESFEEIGEKLKKRLSKYPRKQLVKHLSMRSIEGKLVTVSKETSKSNAGIPPKMIDYALGLACTLNESEEHPNFDSVEAEAEILGAYGRFTEISPANNSENLEKGRHFIAGEFAEGIHYLEAFIRAYTPLNETFEQEFGFAVEDVAEFFIELAEFKNEEDDYREDWNNLYRTTMSSLNRPQALHRRSLKHIELLKKKYETKFESSMVFKFEEIEDKCEVEESKIRNILDRLSLRKDNNLEMTVPYELNPLESRPIIELEDEEYIIPNFSLAYRGIFKTFYYDLLDEYGGEFGDKWGDYLEIWTGYILSDLVGKDSVKRSVNYENGEIDVTAKTQDKLMIIECKTKKIRVESREGDRENIKRDLKKGVGKAWTQLKKSQRAISEGLTELDKYNNEDIIPIIVTSEPYDMYSVSRFTEFLESEGRPPLVIDVFNLVFLSQMLSEEEVPHYVKMRRDFLEEGNLMGMDECDLLCAFKSGNMEIFHDHTIKDDDGGNITTVSINSNPHNWMRHFDLAEVVQQSIENFDEDQNVEL